MFNFFLKCQEAYFFEALSNKCTRAVTVFAEGERTEGKVINFYFNEKIFN